MYRRSMGLVCISGIVVMIFRLIWNILSGCTLQLPQQVEKRPAQAYREPPSGEMQENNVESEEALRVCCLPFMSTVGTCSKWLPKKRRTNQQKQDADTDEGRATDDPVRDTHPCDCSSRLLRTYLLVTIPQECSTA